MSLLALDSEHGRWLVNEEDASLPYRFRRVRGCGWFERRRNLIDAALGEVRRLRSPSIWVNGIWGVQSLAGAKVSRLTGAPLVVRPAGSLGRAALRYRQIKKRAYLRLVERPVLERATAIHCMTAQERDELPGWLRAKAFVVPTGVGALAASVESQERDGRLVLGVLARIHPIKRQHLVLQAVESLVREGSELTLELAGSTSDEAYRRELEDQVASSSFLRGRVAFLDHVESARVPDVVGRWRIAVLLSEQENFGHAVVTAAALGVPTVVSEGVGLGRDLERARAGRVIDPARADVAIRELLSAPQDSLASCCRRFAADYSWPRCAEALEERLRACVVSSGE